MENNPESAPTVTPHLTLQGHSTQTTMSPKFLKISAPQQLWTRMKSVARTPPVIQILYFSWHLPLVLVLLWPVFCCPFFSWPRSTSSDHPSWTSQASPLRRNSISKLAKSFKRCALNETWKKLLNIVTFEGLQGDILYVRWMSIYRTTTAPYQHGH